MTNRKQRFSSYVIFQLFAFMALFLFLSAGEAHAGSGGLGGLVGAVVGGLTSSFSGFLSGISSAISGAMSAAASLISSVLGSVGSVLTAAGLGPLWTAIMNWVFGVGTCGEAATATGTSVGRVICNVVISTQMIPGFISGLAYMAGLLMAVTALVKLKDHVLNPNQTPLSDSMKRFVAGGAFFALPIVTNAARTLVWGSGANQISSYSTVYSTGGAGGGVGFFAQVGGGYGLDSMLVALVGDIIQPIMNLFGAFGYIAGLVFIVIGISRLIKTAQEGPRGPAGIGTIMTFVTAGILFSLEGIMGSFSTSLFGDNIIETYGVLDQSTGDVAVDKHIESVISAVIAFMFIIGWVSFIRGFFIIREVSEGGQASLMAGMTHIFGGALAVNLGPMMMAVQSTFGLNGFGVAFN